MGEDSMSKTTRLTLFASAALLACGFGGAVQAQGVQRSWNSSHQSRSCSQPDLIATGGNGLFYCFAAN
jgi:hypothetical protein